MMSGFDTDGDGQNDLYGYNGRPFQYERRPIQVRRELPLRIYLVNVTEYEPVVSFHLHSAFFKLFRTGTGDTFEYTDTVTLGQGERAIVEIEFEDRGLFMFHAHQSHLADKGLMGWFQVVDKDEPPPVIGFTGGYADEFGDCAPCLGQIGAEAATEVLGARPSPRRVRRRDRHGALAVRLAGAPGHPRRRDDRKRAAALRDRRRARRQLHRLHADGDRAALGAPPAGRPAAEHRDRRGRARRALAALAAARPGVRAAVRAVFPGRLAQCRRRLPARHLPRARVHAVRGAGDRRGRDGGRDGEVSRSTRCW